MMDFKVIVVGAGPAGLAAAVLLAREGVRAALIAPPGHDDPRTVALMHPAIQLLKYLDVWPGTLAGHAAPLRKLKMIDDTGAVLMAPNLEFDSADLSLEAFGWNIPLGALLPVLRAKAVELGVSFIEAAATGAKSEGDAIRVCLSSGDELSAQVCMAADGANSVLRNAAGISTDKWSYDQVAVATSFAHSMGHDDVSVEYHNSAGPFTTVPLPDGRSSLVWMERPARAEALMGMNDKNLAAEIQIATHGERGLISNIGPRKAFPMMGLTARHFAKNRTVLVGEAAHVAPPIGAQGLNMSLKDAALAVDLILAAPDAGGDAVMTHYNSARRAEVLFRQNVIDLMNKSLLLGLLPLESGRALSLAALHFMGPLKKFVMRHGLSPPRDLPFAMRNSA